MPGMNGLDGLVRVRNEFPDIPVALITGLAEKEDVEKAMDLGAIGYFPKTLSGKALLKGIQLVLTGEKFLPFDPDTNKIMPSYRADEHLAANTDVEKAAALKAVNLTPRECDVLSYLVQGISNKEIANELGLQVVTVKLHVRGVCKKLDAKNRTQAALIAHKLGVSASN